MSTTIVEAVIALLALIALSGIRVAQEYERRQSGGAVGTDGQPRRDEGRGDTGRHAARHGALELRRLQMITEVGAEHNSTTIIMIPSEITSMARAIAERSSA